MIARHGFTRNVANGRKPQIPGMVGRHRPRAIRIGIRRLRCSLVRRIGAWLRQESCQLNNDGDHLGNDRCKYDQVARRSAARAQVLHVGRSPSRHHAAGYSTEPYGGRAIHAGRATLCHCGNCHRTVHRRSPWPLHGLVEAAQRPHRRGNQHLRVHRNRGNSATNQGE